MDNITKVMSIAHVITKQTVMAHSTLNSINAESEDVVEFTMELEEMFSIAVTQEEAESFPTLTFREITTFVEKKLG